MGTSNSPEVVTKLGPAQQLRRGDGHTALTG
jgi:hypothetical protein